MSKRLSKEINNEPAVTGNEPAGIGNQQNTVSAKTKIVFAVIAVMLTITAALLLVFLPQALYRDGAKGGFAKAGTITSIITIYALFMLTLAAIYFSKRRVKQEVKFFTTKNITRTAIFSALAIVLYYYVKFPVPAFFPSFLDFQFSDLPALLAGYMMGPISGVTVIVIKCLVKLPATGTSGVGELVDLILGISFVLTSTLIYRRKKNLKGAIVSLVIGSLVCTGMAALANRFIAVPAYIELMFNGSWNPLLGAMNSIFGGKVTKENFYWYYIFLSVIPFNLLRCLITSILTFILYKNLKRLFDRLSV